ncbi:PhzF family phenazine biosynthesis protein [Aquabacterium sp. A7-Y]|uniref:PhzF family phenazine biosynthesis protein n=1 Tax=Aquabacterium sp. A7-Y TaxID=1349605 RepID=UPI00223CDC36|nr:PhzF family phenazine biosynthesis protein [Aquabacterium sp. A7-Y]MCW7539561.1 PhzF family phenazine biosynthesis protein [Aquabacterium sp. A7-Y]
MNSRRFKQVDVFAFEALKGNPLAVVLEGLGLSDAQMQDFARWTNLSETTFLLPPTDPEADYRLRIFTPGGELPFAGHPTLGSCHAWLEAGGVPKASGQVVQQCGVGLVTIRQDGPRLAFAAPPVVSAEVEPSLLEAVAQGLGLTVADVLAARWLPLGPKWLCLRLASAGKVLSLEPDHGALSALGVDIGVVGFHPEGSEALYEVRAFTPLVGVVEDPVTGSLNAALAHWLAADGLVPTSYVAAQGTRLGRAGRVYITRDGETLWVGGASRTCIDGRLSL